jgi:hypothetical protein
LNENGIVNAISVDFSFLESKYSFKTFDNIARVKSLMVQLFFLDSSLIFFTDIYTDTEELNFPDMYLGCFLITLISSGFFQ